MYVGMYLSVIKYFKEIVFFVEKILFIVQWVFKYGGVFMVVDVVEFVVGVKIIMYYVNVEYVKIFWLVYDKVFIFKIFFGKEKFFELFLKFVEFSKELLEKDDKLVVVYKKVVIWEVKCNNDVYCFYVFECFWCVVVVWDGFGDMFFDIKIIVVFYLDVEEEDKDGDVMDVDIFVFMFKGSCGLDLKIVIKWKVLEILLKGYNWVNMSKDFFLILKEVIIVIELIDFKFKFVQVFIVKLYII